MTKEIEQQIQTRFAQLPVAVQEAVTDSSVEEKLRSLAKKHKLHLDQWVLLENEIMLTLLGIEEPENMAKNIAKEVGIEETLAQKLVDDIGVEVFKPIRGRMEITLDSKSLKREVLSKPQKKDGELKKVPSDTVAYKPGQRSNERRDVQEDPYRESIE